MNRLARVTSVTHNAFKTRSTSSIVMSRAAIAISAVSSAVSCIKGRDIRQANAQPMSNSLRAIHGINSLTGATSAGILSLEVLRRRANGEDSHRRDLMLMEDANLKTAATESGIFICIGAARLARRGSRKYRYNALGMTTEAIGLAANSYYFYGLASELVRREKIRWELTRELESLEWREANSYQRRHGLYE